MSINETLVALTAVVLAFGTPIILVAAILLYRMRRARLTHETIARMVEKGQPVPVELIAPPHRPGSDLRTGLILLFLGIGLTVFLLVADQSHKGWGIGMIPLFIGLGFLAAWKLEQRNKQGNGGR